MIKNIYSFIKNKRALSTGFLFAVSSLIFGIWVASIPAVKYRFHFTDATLGLSLLLAPLGAISGMLISRFIFSKVAVGWWMFHGYILVCIIMILQVNAVNKQMLWVCLYFYGLVSFLNGVSANATVNLLEEKFSQYIMSTCHAMYSLGGAVSAGVAAFLFSVNISSGWQIEIVALFIIIIMLLCRKLLLANTEIIHTKSDFKFPSKSILGLSFICMVSFMAEGSVADWSAIFFREELHTKRNLASLGYLGFSAAMTIGRLNGDSIRSKFGRKKIVIFGSILSAVGFLLVSLSGSVPEAVAGFVLVGLGCSCIVPVLFSASAKIPGVSTVDGFAMITTGGLIGFLAGPSVIGFLSSRFDLPRAMLLLTVLAIASAYVAWSNKYLPRRRSARK